MENPDLVATAADDIAERIWEQAAPKLRAELADSTWHAWFQGVRPLRFQHDVLVLGVPSSLAAERIRSAYHPMLDDALRGATGRDVAVEFLVDTDARSDELVPRNGPVVVAEPAPDAAVARGATFRRAPHATGLVRLESRAGPRPLGSVPAQGGGSQPTPRVLHNCGRACGKP